MSHGLEQKTAISSPTSKSCKGGRNFIVKCALAETVQDKTDHAIFTVTCACLLGVVTFCCHNNKIQQEFHFGITDWP